MKRILTASLLFLLTGLAHGAERDPRFVKKFKIPDSVEVVVLTEGDLEPRSRGSYALRLYAGRSDKFSTDDFMVGLVRARNGTVDTVRFDDVDGDGKLDIVVIIRSAGSGGYVSADAFRHRKGSLEWIASVSGLDKKADPIPALRQKIKPSHGSGTPSK